MRTQIGILGRRANRWSPTIFLRIHCSVPSLSRLPNAVVEMPDGVTFWV